MSTLALGIDAASAALLGGCASDLVILRGHLVSTGLAAIRLFRSGGNDTEAALRGSEEEAEK